MLAHLYQLIQAFEQEHGISPNLLYMNQTHCDHLKNAFSDQYSLYDISRLLGMELVMDNSIMHPHVAWTHTADRKNAASW